MASPGIAVVTGSTGFLGSQITQQLLSRGYTVRAAVRSVNPESTSHLQALADALPGSLKLRVFDWSDDKAFQDIAAGALYIFHVAAPTTFGTGDPDTDQREMIDPALSYASTVMHAAAKAGVKRVVLTSSIVAMNMAGDGKNGKVTEAGWNDAATLQAMPYPYMKTVSEKAAWKLAKELNVDMVSINPSTIIGPVPSKRLGYSVDTVKVLLEGQPGAFHMSRFNDVRDAALTHIRAAETPIVKGRYLVSATRNHSITELIDALKAAFPSVAFADVLPEMAELHLKDAPADVTRAEADLGIHFAPPTTSFVDQARSLIALQVADLRLRD